MNVIVRGKRSEKGTRRRRAVTTFGAGRAADDAPLAVPHTPAPSSHSHDGSPARRRLHGPTQDTALYTCHCGYVFEATVSTSVGCPHCGDGQAW